MALELVGGALLSSSLQFMFDRLGSPHVPAYLQGKSKRCDFNDLLGKLRSQLTLISAVLDDAEQKQAKNRSIDAWLDMLEDAFYDADDLLDEIETDALQSKGKAESATSSSNVRKSKKEKFRNLLTRSRKSNSNDGDMESKIKKILERLEDIAKQAGFLDLVKGTVRERPSWRPSPSTSLVDESEVYGRDDNKEEIIRLLLSAEAAGGEKVAVIPIVGMGGLGKTTLAQAVFNDDQVREHFELKSWAYVSEVFDIVNVTKTVLAAVSGNSCDDSKDLNMLQVKLKEVLAGQKFLIVLDDVWNEKYADWDNIRKPFGYGAQGSRIIVTTRSENVASIMGTHTIPTHHLNELDEEVCWQLFAKHAFGSNDFSANPDLERIGRKIAKKCKGLPLAAKTLGGLLRSKLDIAQWVGISKNEIWDLPDEQSDILPALRLSYQYLPSHLKRCFAYCSIFPKGFLFTKDDLILLWMAEDLLKQPKRGKTIEEVGNEYFDDLACRSFFQKSRVLPESHFVMHDLISDLAKFMSRKYCFRLENSNSDKIETKTRHLACVMAREGHDLCESFKPIIETTHLRTFLQLRKFESTCSLLEVVLKLRSLRVLALPGDRMFMELPESISELRHLRYLDLSYTSIHILPESICTLYNLQILKLKGCYKLKKLPADFHLLVNLRYLDVEGCSLLQEMPKQMSKLKSLQRLSTFIVGKNSGTKIGELGELLGLKGTLHIKNLQNVVTATDASEAKLRDKKCLEELEFEWSRETNDSGHESERDVLDNLMPSTALKKLEISGYGGRKFPNWLGDQSFCDMIDINLSFCENCDNLPPLGQLPSLRCLQIEGFHGVVKVGPEFYGPSSSSSFLSLEILRFESLEKWAEWSIPCGDAEPFSNLKELSIINCKKLTGHLPRFLPSLKKMSIFDCPQLSSSLPMMPDVQRIGLVNCDRLAGEYGVLESFRCLQHLQISESLESTTCKALSSTLKTLTFRHCKNLEIPGLRSFDFPNLTELRLEFCDKLITSGMSWNVQGLPNLTKFRIDRCTLENNNIVSFPEEGLFPSTVTILQISDLGWLKTLDSNDDYRKRASVLSSRVLVVWMSFAGEEVREGERGVLEQDCSYPQNLRHWQIYQLILKPSNFTQHPTFLQVCVNETGHIIYVCAYALRSINCKNTMDGVVLSVVIGPSFGTKVVLIIILLIKTLQRQFVPCGKTAMLSSSTGATNVSKLLTSLGKICLK